MARACLVLFLLASGACSSQSGAAMGDSGTSADVTETSLMIDGVVPDDAPMPALDVKRPAVDVFTPTIDTVRPAVDAFTPTVDVEEPAIDAFTPTIDTMRPTVDAFTPTIDTVRPTVDAFTPTIDAVSPEPDGSSSARDAVSSEPDGSSSARDVVSPGIDVADAGVDAGSSRDVGTTRDAPSVDAGTPAMPSFHVWNRSSRTRTEMVKVTLPFAPDALRDVSALGNVDVDGAPAEVVPLKWHYDSTSGARRSVALAQLRARMTLAPGQRRDVTPVRGSTPLPDYATGPGLAAWLALPQRDAQAFVTLRIAGDPTPYTAPIITNTPNLLSVTRTSSTTRFRSHFTRPGASHPLSLTTYLTADARQDHGELVVVLGNDTLAHAIGRINFESVTLTTCAPFHFALREPGAYGVGAPTPGPGPGCESTRLFGANWLADGQTIAFRGRWAVGDVTSGALADSWQAALTHPLWPIADPAAWRASRANGPVGYIPAPRFTTLAAGRAALDALCTEALPTDPFSGLNAVNVSPPNTGDQPDFGSNVPVFYLQAVQTQSPCALRRAALAADRESLRPSHFFAPRGSAEDRVRATDYPELFFWGGRPHFHPSWNGAYPVWQTRTQPFAMGDAHGWNAMDNQHYGNNTVRGVYELTGDPYLRELLVYHQTLVVWGYLTRYIDQPEAERATRTLREALLLYAVEDDGPTSATLRERVIRKNRRLRMVVEQAVAMSGTPWIGTVVNDGRVPLTLRFPDQHVAVGWQTGFHMEFQHLALRYGWEPETAGAIIDAYMTAARRFFDATSGQPVTYFLASDPTQRELGGISETWWTGWIPAALARTTHPNRAFIMNVVAPRLRAALAPTRPGELWPNSDRWNNFE